MREKESRTDMQRTKFHFMTYPLLPISVVVFDESCVLIFLTNVYCRCLAHDTAVKSPSSCCDTSIDGGVGNAATWQ